MGQDIVRMLKTWVNVLTLGSTGGQMMFSPWFPLRLCVSSMDCLAFCKSVPHFKKSNETTFHYSSSAATHLCSYSIPIQNTTCSNSPNKSSSRLSIQKVLRAGTSQIKDLVPISASQTQHPVCVTQPRWEHITVFLQVLDSTSLLKSCSFNGDTLHRTLFWWSEG